MRRPRIKKSVSPLPGEDVAVEVMYSSICHSDIHTYKGDWGRRFIRWCQAMRWSVALWPSVQM